MSASDAEARVKQRYTWTDVRRLDELMDLAHDQTIFLDDIRHDPSRREVVVPMTAHYPERLRVRSFWGLLIRWEEHILKAHLTIGEVDEFKIVDKAEIGTANFNRIRMKGNELTITCGLPVTLLFIVTSLNLNLTVFDSVVRRRSFLSLAILARK